MTEAVQTLSRADVLRGEVRKRITRLQTQFLADDADAVATLARLRRCSPGDPGAEPSVWETTIGGLPEELLGGHEVSDAERAVHASLVLYALHQQSKSVPMHEAKAGIGDAVRKLAAARGRDGNPDQASIRRLHQVVLATDHSGRLYHLRGLVFLLRAESIPLDYGQLGVDLWRLLNPRFDSGGIFARWGRELHTRPRETTTGEEK